MRKNKKGKGKIGADKVCKSQKKVRKNKKGKGKIGADKVCESQVLDRFCLGQVNTMSKTHRAKYAFLRQIRDILQNKSHGIGRLRDISPYTG